MTNEEIINEVKSTYQIEGKSLSKEQENRIREYLKDEETLNLLLEEIYKKARRLSNVQSN